jgi:AraC-like DNA-binding protein
MPIAYEIPVSAASKVINAAASAGVKPEELCRAARLELSALEDLDNQMPFKQLIRLNECAAQLSSDDAFGLHLGEQTDAKTYGVLGYVTMNSQTYGEALNRLIRYQQIRTNAVKFSIDAIGTEAHLAYHYLITDVLPRNRRHESEEMLSTMLQVARKLTGVDLTPREVHFEHEPPENVSEHKRIFRAPVLFNQPFTKLIFDESVLKLPLTQADLTLGSLLERQAEDLLAKSPRYGIFANQVRQLIREGLPVGAARMEIICRKLGISERTLQRKLSEEGTSYKELFEEAQRELSKFYLQKSEMAICEVSFLVGFSQTSAFHRAFRRWTGLTPKEFQYLQKQ